MSNAWAASVFGALLAAAAAGCSGTTPKVRGVPEEGIAAVVVGGRFITPEGETESGRLIINLEGEGDRRAEVYRLPILPRQSLLYQVEPGPYRIGPTRNILGFPQPLLKVRIRGKTYTLRFPPDVLRKPKMDIRPKKIVSIGVFEVRLQQALPGQPPLVKVRLDDSVDTRRKIVQDIIHQMMDPQTNLDTRESAVAWSRALQNTLMELVAEVDRAPLFKSGP